MGVVNATQVQVEHPPEVSFVAVAGNASTKVTVHRNGINEVLKRVHLSLHIAGQIVRSVVLRLIAKIIGFPVKDVVFALMTKEQVDKTEEHSLYILKIQALGYPFKVYR